jgi:tetratricopeptide (TPR) repeat protein
MESATWKDERCASLRFISRCYRYLKDYDNSIKYGMLSIAEAPYLREPYYELACSYYEINDYHHCMYYLELALLIKKNKKVYINEANCYNGTIEDILSICYYYLENFNKALEYIEKSLELDPDNERKQKNKELILLKLN